MTAETPSSELSWPRERIEPDPEFSLMPFWFWNDDLDDDEIKRQMAAFRDQGVFGFVIHARMGLPDDLPYMGERWLRHVRVAVDEAARTGMRVCLYDEGMYPSGSAHGEVVRADPAFAAQGLAVKSVDVEGPSRATPPDEPGARVAIVVAPLEADDKTLNLARARVEEASPPSIDVPVGRWRIMTFTRVPSQGHIRGVHEGEDDRDPSAPPAADLLNPEAMRAFIRLAYEPYHATVGDHFSSTVIAMFTDEPSMLGRGARRGLQPWTEGFAEDFKQRRGYDLLAHLPALFEEAGPRTNRIRADFRLTLAERLEETYYEPLSRWCADHGIALTGHPAGSDEIRPLRHFQIPAQDVVWRYLEPTGNAPQTGPNSTLARCSSSVAVHDRRRRNSNEVYGAYGWQLTMDEMKWLADYLMVRGVNLLYPHAFYYSIRDDRVHERPPDLGMHNAWWPHFRLFADYAARLCGLLTDSRHVCDVAVLSVDGRLPWHAAKWLDTNQVDFNYLEDWRLVEETTIERDRLVVANMAYRTLIIDNAARLPDTLERRLEAFRKAGGRVLRTNGEVSNLPFPPEQRYVHVEPRAPGLRYRRVEKDDKSFYLFANEYEDAIDTLVTVRTSGDAQWFDPWHGRFEPAAGVEVVDDGMRLPLKLERRECLVLCIDPSRSPKSIPIPSLRVRQALIQLSGPWTLTDEKGETVGQGLGDWTGKPALESFTGTITYRTTFEIDPRPDQSYELDLGQVGDWATLQVNDQDLGVRFWKPFVWDVTHAFRPGRNEIRVDVTCSFANRYAPNKRRPPGLLSNVFLVGY